MSGVSCKDARNLFDAYLNGELTPALQTELNAHRLRCSACRHELALLEVSGQVIAADEGSPRLDDEFTDRLLACVSKAQSPSRSRRRLVWIGTQVLAAAAVLTLVVMYLSGPEPRVAGERHEAPRPAVTEPGTAAPAKVAGESAAPAPPADALQIQLDKVLQGWRQDASSLEKVYHSVSPPLSAEAIPARFEDDDVPPEAVQPDPIGADPPKPSETGSTSDDN